MGEAALYPGSPALGQFYIATDGAPQDFWKVVDIARVHTLPAATAPPPWQPQLHRTVSDDNDNIT